MRVLIVTNTYAPALNGQAVFSTNLAEGMVSQGHVVRVIVPAIDRPAFEVRSGVEVEAIKALDLRFIHKDLALAWELPRKAVQTLQEFQPHIVHFQDPAPISQALLWAARKLGVATVGTHHPGPAIWAPYLPGENWLVQRLIVPIVWKYFTNYLNQLGAVVTPSRASARMLQAHSVRQSITPISCGIPNGLLNANKVGIQSAGIYRPHNENEPLFLYVGRFDPEKKVDVLIKAFAQIQDTSAKLLLAGSGACQKSLRELVTKYHLQKRVSFLGKVERSEIAALLAASDIFIMPGDSESLSIATLEAISMGKPVIAADAMALPELVQPGWNGLLFKAGDATDLAGKIDQMMQQKQTWPAMSARSFEIAQSHTMARTLASYVHIYQRLQNVRAVPKTGAPAYPLPGWILNPGWMMSLVQWAALVTILVISLVTRNHPVVAAPQDSIELFNPHVLTEIKEILVFIKQIDIPGK